MPPVQPYIEELSYGYLQGAVERFSRANRKYSLEPLFPEETKPGTKWKIEVISAGRGRGLVKHLSAPTSLVNADWAYDIDCSPTHYGEKLEVTDEELTTLRAIGTTSQIDRARVVLPKVQKLVHRWRALRQYLCAQMLGNGSITLNENRVITTIDYQIPTLTPGASWALAGTDIPTVMQAWIGEFQQTNGVPPRYVLFDPSTIKPYWLQNTAMQTWLGRMRRETVESFFASMMDPWGAYVDNLFNLVWIPITDSYETTDGDTTTLTKYWPTDILTFIAEPQEGEEVLKWRKSNTQQTDGTGGPVSDSIVLEEPKATTYVRVHANGIPALLTEGRIMRVDVTP